MRRSLAIVIVILLGTATGVLADDGTRYGEGVTLDEAVAIPALLAGPDDYVGKQVRIDGVITGVCKMRGCWMQVTDPDTGKGIRVKVEDGVIVFPYSAMGRRASAEGVFEAVPVQPEQAAAHSGDGASCDKSAKEPQPKTGCDPEKHGDMVYLLRGTGAVIY